MGLLSLAKKTIDELIELGYPESVAKKIADGTLPMDEASREARAGLMNMTDDRYYRGHPSARPPTSDADMFMAKERRDIAETYASGGEAYDEATDSYIELPGEVTPLRTNASKFIESDAMGEDWTYPVARIPGFGEGVGTDEIARLTKQSRERYANDLQGSLFTNVRDDIGGELPAGDIANILGSQPEVKIRHADLAAFDPEYNGPNILGGAALPVAAGLLAAGQSDDADAGFTKEALKQLAKKSGDTQVATTGGSYKKAAGILEREGIFGNVLDYGAGRGHGTQYLPGSAKSYEPNPMEGYTPDFTESPDEMFDGIANLNVLNVVPEPIRQEIATDILGKLNKDGVAAIGARSYSDVMNAKNPQLLDDGGIITQKGTYQYGFGGENEGLVDYLRRQTEQFPDREYEITKEPLAATGALVRRTKGLMGPAIAAGALAGGQSEEADAGIIRHGTPDVVRLLQNGMLKTDSDRATAAAIKKYDKLLTENPAFAHREELAGDNLFQTVREQSEFDLGQDGYLTMDDLRDYTIVPVRSDRSMIGTIDQVAGIEIPRETVQGGFQFPMLHKGTGRGWGSGETVARGQHNKFIQAAEETGREVLAAVNMMGPDSINFSTPIARQMQKQFDQLDKIPAADKAEFDAELRSMKGNEDWPGIDSPEAMDWLMGTNGNENIGKRRTDYSTTMGKAKYRDKGFPNYKEAVDAATHSELVDLNLGDSGMAIYKPDLTRDIYADDWHDTYSHVMPGEYVGRLERPVPFGRMFSGMYDSLRNEVTNGKHAPKPYTHEQAIDAANKRKDGFQVADDDWAARVKALDESAAPTVRAVGAPTADSGLLSAQLNNHDEAVDQHMRNLGIDPREDPMYDYGTFLPVRENIVTGESEMALGSAFRDMIRGLFDIAESRKSGVYRPDGLFEVL